MSELIQTRYIRRRLEGLDAEIERARKRLADGVPEERIDARGDLEVLRSRRHALATRLAEIEKGVDTTWERIAAEFAQDVTILEDDLKRWMDGLDA